MFFLLFVQLSSRIQVIEIQNRVEDKKITALCFSAPERVIGKQHNMPLIKRHINDRCMLSNLIARLQQSFMPDGPRSVC